MKQPEPYSLHLKTPSVETYRNLRVGSGLTGKTTEASERGLPNTLFALQVFLGTTPVGVGRVIGDGGCFYQVVDIAVLKQHQGKGLGKAIMTEVVKYIEEHVPESGYVSLIADGEAQDLYARYGFVHTHLGQSAWRSRVARARRATLVHYFPLRAPFPREPLMSNVTRRKLPGA